MAIQTINENNATAKRLLLAAEKVGKLAEQEAKTAELNATISENVVNLIKETGISKMMLPKLCPLPGMDELDTNRSLMGLEKIKRVLLKGVFTMIYLIYLIPHSFPHST